MVGVVMEGTSDICMSGRNVFEQCDLDARHVERHSQYCLRVLLSINDLAIKIIRRWLNRDAVVVRGIGDYHEEARSNIVAMLQCGDKCKELDNKHSMLSLILEIYLFQA